MPLSCRSSRLLRKDPQALPFFSPAKADKFPARPIRAAFARHRPTPFPYESIRRHLTNGMEVALL
jgi:hypothetical protein